ncbi:MAG: hypothetical protein AB7F28_05725 [Candidatus Margulisiibacteriota bacterium]
MTVLFVGCGWLGLPAARLVVAAGHRVVGTTTRPERFKALEAAGVEPRLLDLTGTSEAAVDGVWDACVITVPFRRNLVDPFRYVDWIQAVLAALLPETRVILTSSTLAYAGCVGTVSESTPIDPVSDRQKALLAAESMVLARPGGVLLRLGGLYGADRVIGKSLAQKSHVENANHPVNLVHQDDAARAIAAVVLRSDVQGILNVVEDEHPTKVALYSAQIRRLGLPMPRFEDTENLCKIIDNFKFKKVLGFQFQHRCMDA